MHLDKCNEHHYVNEIGLNIKASDSMVFLFETSCKEATLIGSSDVAGMVVNA